MYKCKYPNTCTCLAYIYEMCFTNKMKTLQFLFRGLLTSMIFVSCNNESSEIVVQDEQQNSVSIDKKEIAFNFITLMKNDAFKKETLDALNNQKPSVLLSKILKTQKSGN